MKIGWLEWNHDWYYLNPIIGTNSGKMLTGGQSIDEKWYYFSENQGNILKNTITPDGYTVDQTGIWR